MDTQMVRLVLSTQNVMTLREVIEEELKESIEEIRTAEYERHKGVGLVLSEERIDAFYQDVLGLLQSDLGGLYVLFLDECLEEAPGEAGEPSEEAVEAQE